LVVQANRVTLQRRDVRIVVERVEATGRVPGRAAGEFGALDQRDIGPAEFRQMVEHAGADDSSADDDDAVMRFHADVLKKGGVIPAKAGIHLDPDFTKATWIPAFAGMTSVLEASRRL